MLHSRRRWGKPNRGFTLAELLIVVGIIAVLLALATGFVVSIQRSIRQRKLDDCARQIYLSAQQELAYLKYGGRMQEVEAAAVGAHTGMLNYSPQDASDEVLDKLGTRIKLHYFTSQSDALKNLVLPTDGIDPELRDAHYVVEYDSINGNVYAVYYADKEAFEESSIPDGGAPVNGSLSGISYDELRDNKDGSTKAKDRQRKTHATVGYYGGSAIWEEIPKEMDVHLTIQNKEQLKLFVNYHEPTIGDAASAVDPVVKIDLTVFETDDNGKPDESKKWTVSAAVGNPGAFNKRTVTQTDNSAGTTVEFKDAEVVTGRWMTELVLDSMLKDKGFHDITMLTTGANIYISARLTTASGVSGDASITANSGFAAKEIQKNPITGVKTGDDVIKIAYGRHLQNLQNYTAVEEFKVEQIRNIYFENISPGVTPDTDEPDAECWYALYYEDSEGNRPHILFRPVTNQKIKSFDGGQFMIRGLTIDTVIADSEKPYTTEELTNLKNYGAGLFGTYYGEELKNIRLVDAVIQLKEESSVESVGCLVGKTANPSKLTLDNCYVYLSEENAKALAQGVTTLQDVKRVISGGKYTGGLIGYANGSAGLDIKNSFAATSIDGQKAGDITLKNYVAGGYLGGLIGHADTTGKVKITESYADNYLFGVNAAGLIGLLNSGQELEVDYAYAAGYACGSGNTADFALMPVKGETNNNMTIEHAYSVVTQLTGVGGESFHVSNGKWHKTGGSNPTVFISGAEAASNGADLGFQFRADMTVSAFVNELNGAAGGKFRAVTTSGAVTNAYNLMTNGLTEYPFPVLLSGNDPTLRKSEGNDPTVEVYRHFGDWRVSFNSGLVYYEKYYDTVEKKYSYGFMGMGSSVGIAKGDETTRQVVADGYAYALTKEDFQFAKDNVADGKHLKVVFTGSTKPPATEAEKTAAEKVVKFTNEDAAGEQELIVKDIKVGEPDKTYILIPLDALIEEKLSTLPEDGLPTVSAGEKRESLYYAISLNDNLYYFNPYFAHTVRTVITAANARDTFYIRTARQLNKLSENTAYWQMEQLNMRQECDIDYRYYKGYAADTSGYKGVVGGANAAIEYKDIEYEKLIDPKRFNLPAGQTAIQEPIGVYGNDFLANYDGDGHVITGVNFALKATTGQSTAIGLFGSNSGKLSNITLNGNHILESGDFKNAEGVYGITTSNINGSGTNVYLGALVGYNSSRGIVENCAVTGYRTASNIKEASYSKILPTYTNSFLYIGGLVGENAGNITQCSADVPEIEVTSTSAIVYGGAFAGYNSGRVTTSYTFGRMHGALDTLLNAYYGGFAGYNTGLINSAYCASSVVVGGLADRYSFTCNAGSVWDCFYVTDTDGSYYENVYAYLNDDEHIPEGVTKVEGFKDGKDKDGNDIKGLDSLSVTGFGSAEEATVTTQKDENGALATAFPYPAVITRGGKLVSVGNWPTDAELGKVGIIYWEYEEGGSNSGYRFSTLSAEGVRNSTLCEEHDDGGYVDRFGYGYYYYYPKDYEGSETAWEITDASYVNLPVAGRESLGIVPTSTEWKYADAEQRKMLEENVTAENALAEAMPGYKFVVYRSGEGALDAELQMIGKTGAEGNFLKENYPAAEEYLPNAYFVLNPKEEADPGQSSTGAGQTGAGSGQTGAQPEPVDPQGPTGEFEHIFVFNPFYADSMVVYKKEKDTARENAEELVKTLKKLGTGEIFESQDQNQNQNQNQGQDQSRSEEQYQNRYSIRSVSQLQMLNWNSYTGNTSQQVQDFNPSQEYISHGVYYWNRPNRAAEQEKIKAVNKNFLYLRYTYIDRNTDGDINAKVAVGSPRDSETGYNFYWQQSHDVGRSKNEVAYEFIPIGSLRDIGTPEGNDFSSYPYIVYFCGVYDGGQYEIRNVNIGEARDAAWETTSEKDDGRQAIGLFGVTMGAKLQNIIMYSEKGNNSVNTGRYVKGWYTIGGLVGFAAKGTKNDSVISNCSIAGYKIIDWRRWPGGNGGGNMGGLIGATNMPITNCTAVTNIEINVTYDDGAFGANLRVGGLTGCLRNTMKNCYSGGKISYGSDHPDYNGKANHPWIWIGGLNGGIYMRGARMENLIGPTGLVSANGGPDQTPTIENCYSYMELPATNPGWPRQSASIQSIASNGEYHDPQYQHIFPNVVKIYGQEYTFTTDVLVKNSYALDKYVGAADDFYSNQAQKDWSGTQTLNFTWVNGAARTIRIQNNGHSPYISYQQMAKELFNDNYLGSAGFGRVTSDEEGVVVNGKYSFNSSPQLDGKNYPFPTILHQTSNNVIYNVHYGDWPNSGIVAPVMQTINLLTDRKKMEDPAHPGTFIDGPATIEFDAEITSDVGAGGSFTVVSEEQSIATAKVKSTNNGRYTIEVTGHKKGVATLELSYTAGGFTYKAYVTVMVNAEVKLADLPEKLVVFAGTTHLEKVKEDTTTGTGEWIWKAYAGNTIPTDPQEKAEKELIGGSWWVSANKDSGLKIKTYGDGSTSGTGTAGSPAPTESPVATSAPTATPTATSDPSATPTPTSDPAATPTPTPADTEETVTTHKIGDNGEFQIVVDEKPESTRTSVTVQYEYEYTYNEEMNGQQVPVKVVVTGSQVIPVTIVETAKSEYEIPNGDDTRISYKTTIALKEKVKDDSGQEKEEPIVIPAQYDYWEIKYFTDSAFMTEDDTVNAGANEITIDTDSLIPGEESEVTVTLDHPRHSAYYAMIVGGTYANPQNPTEESKTPKFAILLEMTKVKIETRSLSKVAMVQNTTTTNSANGSAADPLMPAQFTGRGSMLFSLSPLRDVEEDIELDTDPGDGSIGEEDLSDYDWMPYQVFAMEQGLDEGDINNESAVSYAVSQMMAKLDSDGTLEGGVTLESSTEFDAASLVEAELDPESGDVQITALEADVKLPQTVQVVFYGVRKDSAEEDTDEANIEEEESDATEEADDESAEEDPSEEEKAEKPGYMVLVQPVTIMKSIDLGEKIVSYDEDEEDIEAEETEEEETLEEEKVSNKEKGEPDTLLVEDEDGVFDTSDYEWIPVVYADADYQELAPDEEWTYSIEEGMTEQPEFDLEDESEDKDEGKYINVNGNTGEKITVVVADLLATAFEPEKSLLTFQILGTKAKEEEVRDYWNSRFSATPGEIPEALASALPEVTPDMLSDALESATPDMLFDALTSATPDTLPIALASVTPGVLGAMRTVDAASKIMGAGAETATEAPTEAGVEAAIGSPAATASEAEKAEETTGTESDMTSDTLPGATPTVLPDGTEENEYTGPMMAAYIRFYGFKHGESLPSVVISLKVITAEAKALEPAPVPTKKPTASASRSPLSSASPTASASGSPEVSGSPETSESPDTTGSPLTDQEESPSSTGGLVPSEIPTVSAEPGDPTEEPGPANGAGTEEIPVPTEIAGSAEGAGTPAEPTSTVPAAIPGLAGGSDTTEEPGPISGT